jgi:hypothetical protein
MHSEKAIGLRPGERVVLDSPMSLRVTPPWELELFDTPVPAGTEVEVIGVYVMHNFLSARRRFNRSFLLVRWPDGSEGLVPPEAVSQPPGVCLVCRKPSVGLYLGRAGFPSCGSVGCELRMRGGIDSHEKGVAR